MTRSRWKIKMRYKKNNILVYIYAHIYMRYFVITQYEYYWQYSNRNTEWGIEIGPSATVIV